MLPLLNTPFELRLNIQVLLQGARCNILFLQHDDCCSSLIGGVPFDMTFNGIDDRRIVPQEMNVPCAHCELTRYGKRVAIQDDGERNRVFALCIGNGEEANCVFLTHWQWLRRAKTGRSNRLGRRW